MSEVVPSDAQDKRAKALTICQPYASLIADGSKRVENRTWETRYRGLLYIHAGKSREWLTTEPPLSMPFGAIVAMATLVDCINYDYLPKRSDLQRKYPWLAEHEHASGPWCWVLENVSPVGPWPWKGAQGLWSIDESELNRVANRCLGIPEPA